MLLSTSRYDLWLIGLRSRRIYLIINDKLFAIDLSVNIFQMEHMETTPTHPKPTPLPTITTHAYPKPSLTHS